ncbi:MAG: Uma2 family endonuclease [Planctomycetaceae bacterium]|nr:Uma2 family endonuclease [Planctomycetaceae bacterium]
MSMAVATKTHHTPEDLLAMPDGKSYELVGGQLEERQMGIESSWVAGRIFARLDRFCEEHKTGWALPADSGYQCFPHDPGMVRRPDASFVKTGRFPGDVLPKGWAKSPPDLAVEVVSPNDLVYKLEEKLNDYRKVGVPLIWVINPESRTVMVYRRDGSISRLLDDDELSGEDVVPGFRCPIREILPPLGLPEEAQPTPTRTNGPG